MGSLSLGFSPVVLGHTDELWALATHPDLPQFLTAGFDNIVQLWDAMSHTVVWSKDIAVSSFSPFTWRALKQTEIIQYLCFRIANRFCEYCWDMKRLE